MLISNLLTTEDQVMIFSNSLTDLGKSWEWYGNESKNDDKRIITKYAIIRNIPTHYLDPIELRIHFPDIKFEWMDKTPESRKILKFSWYNFPRIRDRSGNPFASAPEQKIEADSPPGCPKNCSFAILIDQTCEAIRP